MWVQEGRAHSDALVGASDIVKVVGVGVHIAWTDGMGVSEVRASTHEAAVVWLSSTPLIISSHTWNAVSLSPLSMAATMRCV